MTNKRRTKAEKVADEIVERVCTSGLQIRMTDISKLFAEGRKALAEGRDVEKAIRDFVAARTVETIASAVPPASITVRDTEESREEAYERRR